MLEEIKKYLNYHFHRPNYFYFMLSLILLIMVPPLSELSSIGHLFLDFSFGLVILMGIYYTTENVSQFMGMAIFGTALFLVYVLGDHGRAFSFLTPLMVLLFFLIIFRNLMRHILYIDRIGLNEVYASVAGYLVLGIMVAPFFYLIAETIPEAFTIGAEAKFYDFIYFSYITLTTIGFGDISPVHQIARSFTVLVGLFGQLYLTILVAIIIGKYLAFENQGR